MSWGTCYTGCNNIHFDFPPIMADGRNYATWQPGAEASDKIRKEAGIDSNWKYRQYMTANADSIIRRNQVEACDQCCSCPAVYGDGSKGSNAPFLYKSCLDDAKPAGYESSDLKSLYLSSYQLQCRLSTPVLTQDQLLSGKYANWN